MTKKPWFRSKSTGNERNGADDRDEDAGAIDEDGDRDSDD
jgi:hypothetical protein